MTKSVFISNARIQPYQTPVIQSGNRPGFRGGLYFGESNDLLPFHQKRQFYTTPFDHDNPEHIPGTYAYADGFDLRFGHFMAECIHRILISKDREPSAPWIIVGTPDSGDIFDALPNFVQSAYSIMGLSKANTKIITTPVIVDNLHVSALASSLGGKIDPGYTKIQNKFIHPKLDQMFGDTPRPEFIYVTRSSYRFGGFLGHRLIDEWFEKAGFHIFHPQCHSLPVQMDTYRKAKVVIFDEGSALHGLEIIGNIKATIGYLNRRAGHTTHFKMLLEEHTDTHWLLEDNVYIGSLKLGETSSERSNKGTAVFDLDKVAERVNSTIGRSVFKINKKSYRKHSLADLNRYIKSSIHLKQKNPLSPDLIQDFKQRYHDAISAVCR